ncbi:MAG TPA: AAA family ATPase [Candidatus Saccharimonadales bacterium]|nr:AAA family ATPase [Candidatus Saccharimonadales bacterium]
MTTLVLPDPSLVVLIGAAGSGKSTLAGRLFAPEEIVSSDALRAVVSGDPANQGASKVAFRILHRTVEHRLGAGLMTVVDATNTLARARRPLLDRARRAGVPATAIVLDLARDRILAQNAARTERVVDPEVIDRHLDGVRDSLRMGRLIHEGFEHVAILRTPGGAGDLTVTRRRPAPTREPAGGR